MVEIQVTGKISMASEVMKLLQGQYRFNVPSTDLKFTQAAEPGKRKNQKNLSTDEQFALLSAWQNLNFGALGATVAEHAMLANHVIHSMDRYPYGTYRLLPWHRFYLYYFEKALHINSNNPNITIPYWDWTVDQAIPDWSKQSTIN